MQTYNIYMWFGDNLASPFKHRRQHERDNALCSYRLRRFWIVVAVVDIIKIIYCILHCYFTVQTKLICKFIYGHVHKQLRQDLFSIAVAWDWIPTWLMNVLWCIYTSLHQTCSFVIQSQINCMCQEKKYHVKLNWLFNTARKNGTQNVWALDLSDWKI